MFEQWLNSDFTHSLLLSPLMGVFFGALFAGLTKSIDDKSPRTIVRTREVYRERVIYRHINRSNTSGDNGAILFAGAFGLMILIWQYAVWANQVHLYLSFLVSSVLSFSVTTAVISVLKGQFTSHEWWIYVVFPMVFLVFSMYLLDQAIIRFDPELSQLARDTSWYNFYIKSLNDYGRNFMITHVIGVAVLSLLILVTTIIELHYLSLMNQRSNGVMQGFWSVMVSFTGTFSGAKGIVACSFLALLAFLLINEHVAGWMTK
jgi:uncharacterized membrane protein (Fun14 family)